jgi:hypothetical protein
MTHRISRALLGALALAAAAGCGGSTEFTIERTFQVRGAGTGGTLTASQDVDLREEAGEAWTQRDHLDDVRILSAEGTLTAVAPGNTAATGDLAADVSRLYDGGVETVAVLDAQGVPIAVGTRLQATNLDPASDLLERALESDGQVSIAVHAAVPEGAAADFTVRVVMQVEADWSVL